MSTLRDRERDSRRLLKQLLPVLLTLLCAVIGYPGLALTPFRLRHMAVFSAVGLLFADDGYLLVSTFLYRLIVCVVGAS